MVYAFVSKVNSLENNFNLDLEETSFNFTTSPETTETFPFPSAVARH